MAGRHTVTGLGNLAVSVAVRRRPVPHQDGDEQERLSDHRRHLERVPQGGQRLLYKNKVLLK